MPTVGDITHGEQKHIFRTARQHKPAGAEQHNPTTDCRKLVIDPVLSYAGALVNSNSPGGVLTPITVDEGVRIFCELLRRPAPATSLVITGRFGEPPTLKMT